MTYKFWEWYNKQGFQWTQDEFWKLDESIKKTLLVGMLVKFLYDLGVGIPSIKGKDTFSEFYKWLDTGMAWASGED